MKGWRGWLCHLFFPERCCICGQVIPLETHICADCREHAPFVLPPVCELCGRSEDRCFCGKRRHHYERCVTPIYYEELGKRAIGHLKNVGDRSTVEGLALEMAEVLRREYGGIAFDVITSVPMHPKDWRMRGFDPAYLLAQELSHCTDIPFRPLLCKLFQTQPQKELTAARRQGNLLGAFDLIDGVEVTDCTILLVDDVITTGATLDECAKMLCLYGASSVYVVTAAGSVLHKMENSV